MGSKKTCKAEHWETAPLLPNMKAGTPQDDTHREKSESEKNYPATQKSTKKLVVSASTEIF